MTSLFCFFALEILHLDSTLVLLFDTCHVMLECCGPCPSRGLDSPPFGGAAVIPTGPLGSLLKRITGALLVSRFSFRLWANLLASKCSLNPCYTEVSLVVLELPLISVKNIRRLVALALAKRSNLEPSR